MSLLPFLCSLKLTQKKVVLDSSSNKSFLEKNLIEDPEKVNVQSDLAEKRFLLQKFLELQATFKEPMRKVFFRKKNNFLFLLK